MNEGAVMGEQNSKSATGGEVSIGPRLVGQGQVSTV